MAISGHWLSVARACLKRRAPGQGLLEYGLIVAVVSIAAVVLIMAIGPRIASMFSSAGAGLSSDRRRKTAFAAVDAGEVLRQVALLPMQGWSCEP